MQDTPNPDVSCDTDNDFSDIFSMLNHMSDNTPKIKKLNYLIL